MDREQRTILKQRADRSKRLRSQGAIGHLYGTLLCLLLEIVRGLPDHSLHRRSDRIGGAARAELFGRAPGGRQPAAHRGQGAGHRHERDHHHHQRALATSRQIAESAQRVSQIANETVGRDARRGQTVQRTQESVVGIKRQVDLIVSHMLELGKKSQQIGGILELIDELSEQTNILAINATIEAADAGEAGGASPSSPTRSASSPTGWVAPPRRSAA